MFSQNEKFAELYLKQGWSILPIEARSKKPLLEWKKFTQSRPTIEEVRSWFSKWPTANLAIITGQISNLIVVDLDGHEGLNEANRLELKSSVTVITGKGRHLYYKWQPNVQNAVRIKPGIDIRSDSGFVLAPPSIHESGKRYRWLRNGVVNAKTLDLFPVLLQEISPVPTVLHGIRTDKKEEGWKSQRLDIAKALEEMKNGNVDDTLTSILGRLRHDGYSAVDARDLLQYHPSMVHATEGHLEAKIENIWRRYEPASKSAYSRTPELHSTTSHFSDGRGGNSLIIHSPTNPDSLKHFEQLQLDRTTDSESSLRTGYPKLDQMLQGGLKSSRLFTIAARTGTGKTNFLIGIARTLCEAGKRVLIFSTETPYTEFWQRYMATLREPENFKQHALYVCDSFAPNIEKVEEAINEIKPDIFMFDHINHVSEEQRELGAFMQGLNFLRRKYECAGIVTAQLNRSADWIDLKSGEKVTPRMSMIKGSGTIEQASSRVLLLSETRVTPEMTEIVGNLDKNDNGPKGLIHFGLLTKPYKMIEL